MVELINRLFLQRKDSPTYGCEYKLKKGFIRLTEDLQGNIIHALLLKDCVFHLENI